MRSTSRETSSDMKSNKGRKPGQKIGTPSDLQFLDEPEDWKWDKPGRQSPYSAALRELEARGGMLRVSKPGALPSLTANAKKIGYRLLRTIRDGELYVKLGEMIVDEKQGRKGGSK